MSPVRKNPCRPIDGLIMGFANVLDGTVRILSLGFLATDLGARASERMLRRALDLRRSK